MGTLTKPGGLDGGFVLKYNSTGTPQWLRWIAGSFGAKTWSIDVDSSGNLYVSGSYSSRTITLETGFTLTNSGLNTNDIFILKYSNEIYKTQYFNINNW